MPEHDGSNTTEDTSIGTASINYCQLVTEGGITRMEMESLGCAGQEK
jgi:hypothetical protein